MRSEGEQELKGMKGVLEAGDRKVCMPKTKTCLQGPKKAGEAAEQRRAGCGREGGAGQLR